MHERSRDERGLKRARSALATHVQFTYKLNIFPRWARWAANKAVFPRKTSPAARGEERQLYSQAKPEEIESSLSP